MRYWLIGFIALNTLDCILTWLAIDRFGAYEALGFLFASLPTLTSRMIMKMIIGLGIGFIAYYCNMKWALRIGTCLLGLCVIANGLQIVIALII